MHLPFHLCKFNFREKGSFAAQNACCDCEAPEAIHEMEKHGLVHDISASVELDSNYYHLI